MDTLDSKNDNQISDEAVRNLGGAAGWVIAVAILMFLGSLFTLIGALQTLSAGAVGLISLLFAGAYGYLGYLLIMQGISVNKYRLTKSSADFDVFAKNYKMYWMFLIILIITMVLLVLVMANSMGGRGFRGF
ncbi:MAG: hypothetical protein ACHQF2_09790 [Flavobacteriales bacterium]